MLDSVRADKWLWAIRFYKTRALAGEVLGNGKVKRNGHVMKRSSSIHIGDVLEIPFAEGPGVRDILVALQQNLWVNFGSGSFPSV
jgi:ribosome-associated heat shock protein Hsp15